MIIRKATENEMLTLWGRQDNNSITPTANFFVENIISQNAEFWTIDDNGSLIGELYVFKNLSDTDFADGAATAYLCAFRVKKDYRGKGLGSKLMKTVLAHLKDCGFDSVTIGVDKKEEHNIRLYQRLGFDRKIKDCYADPCDMDDNMQPKQCPCFMLLAHSFD